MKKKQIIRLFSLMLMWLIGIIAFDVVINIKVFDKSDWIPFFEYTLTVVVPFTSMYCLLIGISEVLLTRLLIREHPFAILVLIKAIIQFLVIYILHLSGSEIIREWLPPSPNSAVNTHYEYLGQSLNLAYTIYFFIVSFHFSLYFQIARKFGSTNLLDIILGKYYRPKEDNRIFMFLDLDKSTTIAQEIGHLKYSRLIQECFEKLTSQIEMYDAEVYQYVGDEAVLTWNDSNRKSAKKSIDLYLNFKKALEASGDYFLNEYGVLPHFKVGVSYGMVAVAEVGDYKRDIAFHGDVLNTGARLCMLCKEIMEDILYSNEFYKLLGKSSQLEYVGDYILKGRQNIEKVFKLSPKS